MLTKKELLKQLRNETENIRKQIKHNKFYNFRNHIVKKLIKSGIAIDYALPFIIAGVLTFHLFESKGETLFITNATKEKAKKEKLITSTGLTEENSLLDYDNVSHATSWQIIQEGLYERTITTYKIDDTLDMTNAYEHLFMSKEEIEQTFDIADIQCVQKSHLNNEDEIYNDEMLIITSIIEEDKVSKEKQKKNVSNAIFYLGLTSVYGCGLDSLRRLLIKTHIRDKLRQIEPKFKQIDEQRVYELKNILKVKQENLTMLDDNSKSISSNDNSYSYKLKKNREV
ncbi:MAG TPA: hypothetical protein GXZ95_04535 [Mollicutes bacterium]|nr:hypothetical protein [Mollicutes bacterium]